MPLWGNNGWVWIACGDQNSNNAVHVHVATTRSGLILDQMFPYFDIPLVSDGYSPYSKFETQQRCWAHLLRDGKDISNQDTRTICLYEKLQQVFSCSKIMAEDSPIPERECRMLEFEVLGIAEGYNTLEHTFAGKLRAAASNLFTFLKHPGMEPTNNLAERNLRPIVIFRKISNGIMSIVGMEIFNTLMTCIVTIINSSVSQSSVF